MIYDGFQIIIHQGKVDGWLDASGTLNVGEQKLLTLDDVHINDTIISIINNFGNPDTYSANELAIYDNIVLYLEDVKIKKIEIL